MSPTRSGCSSHGCDSSMTIKSQYGPTNRLLPIPVQPAMAHVSFVFEQLARDVRHTLRSLFRSRGFSLRSSSRWDSASAPTPPCSHGRSADVPAARVSARSGHGASHLLAVAGSGRDDDDHACPPSTRAISTCRSGRRRSRSSPLLRTRPRRRRRRCVARAARRRGQRLVLRLLRRRGRRSGGSSRPPRT